MLLDVYILATLQFKTAVSLHTEFCKYELVRTPGAMLKMIQQSFWSELIDFYQMIGCLKLFSLLLQAL